MKFAEVASVVALAVASAAVLSVGTLQPLAFEASASSVVLRHSAAPMMGPA